MLFPVHIIDIIKFCSYWADRLARTDLIEGYIVTENDYTSNFTGSLRREINTLSIPGLKAKIQVLNPKSERQIGADACIIFQNNKEFKASIFEAKWPRLKTHKNMWDSEQRSTGSSHFHSQFLRQKAHSHYAAIWEMFYCEFPFGKQPNNFPDKGSACVWHADALAATLARPDTKTPWSDYELDSLLEGKSLSIAEIIKEICICNQGVPLEIGNYRTAFGDIGLPHKALIITYIPEG